MTEETVRKLAFFAHENEEFGLDEIRVLLDEIDRLRGLVKSAERSNVDAACPWYGRWDDHRRSCAAFTPNGELK